MRLDELPKSARIEDRRGSPVARGGIGIGTNIFPSTLVFLMSLTDLSGGPAVFLGCMAAVNQSAVTP